MIHWFYLFMAIIFEIAGTTAMKLSDGFTRLIPSVSIFVFYGIAFVFLTLTLKKLELSVAYAIWAGVGTLLISVIGVYVFSESMNVYKAVSIVLIIIGVMGLKLSGSN